MGFEPVTSRSAVERAFTWPMRHAYMYVDNNTTYTRLELDINLYYVMIYETLQNYLSNEAKVIMSMYPGDRTEEQVKLALLSLNQTVEAFGEFPIKLQRSLASVGWYEK